MRGSGKFDYSILTLNNIKISYYMNLFYRYPLVFMNLATITGILWSYLNIPVIFLIFSFCLIIVLLWNRKFKRYFHVSLIIIVFLMGWGNTLIHRTISSHIYSQVVTMDDQLVEAIGTVINISLTKSGKYRIGLENIELSNSTSQLGDEFGYFVYLSDKPDLNIDDTLCVKGTFLIYESQRNPGQFDLQKYYMKKGVYGLVLPDKSYFPIIYKSTRTSLRKLIEATRDHIRTILSTHLEAREAGLLTALLIGDRSGLDPEMKLDFQNTGVIHVLAVSGLHVGYIVLILTTLTPMLKIPWGYNRIFILAGLLVFAALTNFTPSVNRACMMAGFYMLAPVFHRPTNSWNILSTSSFILLFINPEQLFDIGFLLSFAAVGSILFFYNEINSSLPEKLRVESIKKPYLRYPWALFIVSLSAQIGTIPITIFVFKKLPVIALLANVLIVPLVGVLVAGGIILLAINWIPIVVGWFANALWLTTVIITGLAKYFSGFYFSIIKVNIFQEYHIVLYLLITVGLVLLLRKKYNYAILIILISANIMIWKWTLSSGYMDVLYLDVGQGDCAIIRFENGKTMIVDTGYRSRKRDMGKQVIVPVLNHLGVTKIDWLIMTHPHSDHIGGTMAIFSEFPVDTVIDTDIDYGSHTYNQILEYVENRKIGYKIFHSESFMKIDDETYIQFLGPDTGSSQKYNINNSSLVFRLVHGENSFIFQGDAELEAEKEMLSYDNYLDSDVLKVGHHGSITSSSLDYLNKVSPQVAVISVGENNKFSHPSNITVNRIKSLETTLFRTDDSGAIWFRSDGKRLEHIQWK